MLDLDLDLEADLGVDTVKQAEMFAAIREIYSIPRDENRKLRDYPTLAAVIRFVYGQRPDLAGAAAPAAEPAKVAAPAVEVAPVATTQATIAAPAAATLPDESVKERILDLAVEKTGYPRDMLDLDLDLEADLGVDTVKQAEMFAAIREIYSIPRDENRKLRDYPTLAAVIRFVYGQRPDLAGAAAPAAEPAKVAAPAVEVAPVATTQATIAAPAAATLPDESVKERILDLAVEKTGYPRDMLDLDLDLEADLGVDTVKQAEMFAAIREIYSIPRDENRKLRDYPTLAAVIRFVYGQRPDLAGAAAPAAEPAKVAAPAVEVAPVATTQATIAAPAAATLPDESVKERILDLAVEKTGYPRDMLDLDLDLEADLGVDTVKQAEMFAAIREIYSIPRDENRKLRDYPTLAAVIRFVYEQRPDLAGAAAPAAEPAKVAAPAVEVAAVATTQATIAAPAAATLPDGSVKERILDLAVEKTGYPRDMLDLDLDLEADLGVDTVKQAEMFAAIREIYSIPRDENRKLRDYPTLAAVIRFVYEQRPDLAGNPQAPPPASTSTAAVAVAPKAPAPISRLRPPLASFGAADRVPRRVPVPNLRPPLDLCKPTGVTLGHGSRVVIMPDTAGVSNELTQRLRSMDVEVLVLDDTRNVEALTELLQK